MGPQAVGRRISIHRDPILEALAANGMTLAAGAVEQEFAGMEQNLKVFAKPRLRWEFQSDSCVFQTW